MFVVMSGYIGGRRFGNFEGLLPKKVNVSELNIKNGTLIQKYKAKIVRQNG